MASTLNRSPLPALPDATWHALSVEAAAATLESDLHQGLTEAEARVRLERYGRNELAGGRTRGWLQVVAEQFKDVMVWILVAAMGVALLLGETTDAVVILAIVLLN